jgi:CHAD domain-containing protein
MADVKWIPNLAPDDPLHEAARRVLQARLSIVAARLPQAIERAYEDVEHVHQLRVATRRATAAVRIFADCLPTKARKRLRKALRTIRRAAGDARDWDVFLEMLAARGRRLRPEHKAGMLFLLGYGHGQRAAAQQELLDLRTSTVDDFAAIVAAALDAVKESSATLRQLAVPMIGQLLSDLHAAMAQDLDKVENLHAVRILGKKLRYSMEIFAPCFEPAFKKKSYPAIEEMQEILGEANDSAVAVRRLEKIAHDLVTTSPSEYARVESGLSAVLRYHQRRLPQFARKFQAWRREWQVLSPPQELPLDVPALG